MFRMKGLAGRLVAGVLAGASTVSAYSSGQTYEPQTKEVAKYDHEMQKPRSPNLFISRAEFDWHANYLRIPEEQRGIVRDETFKQYDGWLASERKKTEEASARFRELAQERETLTFNYEIPDKAQRLAAISTEMNELFEIAGNGESGLAKKSPRKYFEILGRSLENYAPNVLEDNAVGRLEGEFYQDMWFRGFQIDGFTGGDLEAIVAKVDEEGKARSNEGLRKALRDYNLELTKLTEKGCKEFVDLHSVSFSDRYSNGIKINALNSIFAPRIASALVESSYELGERFSSRADAAFYPGIEGVDEVVGTYERAARMFPAELNGIAEIRNIADAIRTDIRSTRQNIFNLSYLGKMERELRDLNERKANAEGDEVDDLIAQFVARMPDKAYDARVKEIVRGFRTNVESRLEVLTPGQREKLK